MGNNTYHRKRKNLEAENVILRSDKRSFRQDLPCPVRTLEIIPNRVKHIIAYTFESFEMLLYGSSGQ